jgi:hypothetical protein
MRPETLTIIRDEKNRRYKEPNKLLSAAKGLLAVTGGIIILLFLLFGEQIILASGS